MTPDDLQPTEDCFFCKSTACQSCHFACGTSTALLGCSADKARWLTAYCIRGACCVHLIFSIHTNPVNSVFFAQSSVHDQNEMVHHHHLLLFLSCFSQGIFFIRFIIYFVVPTVLLLLRSSSRTDLVLTFSQRFRHRFDWIISLKMAPLCLEHPRLEAEHAWPTPKSNFKGLLIERQQTEIRDRARAQNVGDVLGTRTPSRVASKLSGFTGSVQATRLASWPLSKGRRLRRSRKTGKTAKATRPLESQIKNLFWPPNWPIHTGSFTSHRRS